MTTTEIFLVENIRCEGCVNAIKSTIQQIKGVHGVSVFSSEKKVCVMGIGLNRELITKELSGLGYPTSGKNSLFKKAISLIACSTGR